MLKPEKIKQGFKYVQDFECEEKCDKLVLTVPSGLTFFCNNVRWIVDYYPLFLTRVIEGMEDSLMFGITIQTNGEDYRYFIENFTTGKNKIGGWIHSTRDSAKEEAILYTLKIQGEMKDGKAI